jgi:mRNA interferase RelE/StbE
VKLVVTARAQKDLEGLDKSIQKRILMALDMMISRPQAADLKKLKGHEDLWRLRVGEFRVILRVEYQKSQKQVDQTEGVLYVLHVFNRREAYRRF